MKFGLLLALLAIYTVSVAHAEEFSLKSTAFAACDAAIQKGVKISEDAIRNTNTSY